MPTEGGDALGEETATASDQSAHRSSVASVSACIQVVLRRILHLRLCSTFPLHGRGAVPFRWLAAAMASPFAVPSVSRSSGRGRC